MSLASHCSEEPGGEGTVLMSIGVDLMRGISPVSSEGLGGSGGEVAIAAVMMESAGENWLVIGRGDGYAVLSVNKRVGCYCCSAMKRAIMSLRKARGEV